MQTLSRQHRIKALFHLKVAVRLQIVDRALEGVLVLGQRLGTSACHSQPVDPVSALPNQKVLRVQELPRLIQATLRTSAVRLPSCIRLVRHALQ